MKTSKKILILVYAISRMAVTAAAVGYSLYYIINSPVWAGFILAALIQLFGQRLWESWLEANLVKSRLDELNAKEYREYILDLPCQHCSAMQPVTINLDEDEFVCKHCSKENKVVISIMTAAKIPEIDEKGILGRMQKLHDEFV